MKKEPCPASPTVEFPAGTLRRRIRRNLLQSIRNACVTDPKTTDAGRAQSGDCTKLALALNRPAAGGPRQRDCAGRKTCPTSGIFAVFEFDGNDWNDVAFRRGGGWLALSAQNSYEADFQATETHARQFR